MPTLPTKKPVVTAKKNAADPNSIMAYSMKKKEKVEMLNAVLTPTSRGSWIAKGQDEEGNNVSVIMSKVTAEAHIKAGRAKKGK